MAIVTDLSESVYRQAETFLATLDEDWTHHIAAIGSRGRAAKSAREPYEALIRVIAYQQLRVEVGDAILDRFIALYPVTAFPAPQQALAIDEAALCACGFFTTKLATTRGIAQAVLDGIVPTREQAFAMSDEAFIERLVTLRGVGRWTVGVLLTYASKRSGILPADSFGVHDDYRRLKRFDIMSARKQTETIGFAWSPYRTVVV